MPIFQLGLWNAWWLYVPFVLGGSLIIARDKDAARRMADMTGYNNKEKFFTVTASLAPYPYMFLAAWTPFTDSRLLLWAGAIIYLAGMALFFLTLYVIISTPLDLPFLRGAYRISRNPLYVAATLVFLSVALVTANSVLLAFLIGIIVLQHYMILAEERVCQLKYGANFASYMQQVPRYVNVAMLFGV